MSWLREPDAEPIPGYRLIEPLGSGGFGEVWKCEAPGGIHKAIKFVYGNLNSLDVDAVRAEQEFKALEQIKKVRHPFICSLDLIQVINGELVIVMELCDRTLHDLYEECKQQGLIGIPRDSLLRYLRDVAEALDFMHDEHKLQHLDVKPKNLFLISDRVKVADFGLVKHLEKLSGSGILGGVTPLYAPPETFKSQISEHCDQYSLAIVYQELLTGHRPYQAKNLRQLAQLHLSGEPDLRPLPPGERPVIARALSKDPKDRFPNCMEFVRLLYNARAPIVVGEAKSQPEMVGAKARPKTMHDTLEDMFLEVPSHMEINLDAVAPDAEVDLGGPPPSSEGLLGDSDLGVTMAQPETGALRPTVFIGLGSFGRKALLELRCRFVDRFGDLSKIPLLRFLCLDPDPETVSTAVKGAPEVALSRSEVHTLPLQPVGDYRRRNLEQLSDWLPREKIYAMPRSLQPQGSRALGRLAFVDNYNKLISRIRREIQEVTNPETIFNSVTQTGLAVRDNTPRIYVLCSASGASSGMLVDLGYAIRRELMNMRHHDSPMTLFLMCSAPNDPASPKSELANVHATLTEISHFSDPSVQFSGQYGASKQIVDDDKPFGSVYLLPLPHRGPDGFGDVLSHLGSYLFHEVTTPLGLKLDKVRQRASNPVAGFDYSDTIFRSLGTYAVWFPRGLLLRNAARVACRRLIESWLESSKDEIAHSHDGAEVTSVIEDLVSNPELQEEKLTAKIEEKTREQKLTDLGATPGEAVTGLLSTLEEQVSQSVAQEDPGNWGRQALNRIRDWIGGCESSFEVHEWKKTKVNRSMHLAAQKVAKRYAEKLVSKGLYSVMENPGPRVAAAEFGLSHFEKLCKERAALYHNRLEEQKIRTATAWSAVEVALADCAANHGGFLWFGGRSIRKLLQVFVEKLSAFTRQRLQEERIGAIEHFYMALHNELEDQNRDLGFCRQRLRHLQENLEHLRTDLDEDLTTTRPGAEVTMTHSPIPSTEAYWDAIRQSHTARVLLPDNEHDLERSAIRLLHRLESNDWYELDKKLHERVLAPRGGLFSACMKGGDLTKALAVPLMDEAITILSDYLPIMDVAQILGLEFGFTYNDENGLESSPASPELEAHIKNYLERATPLFETEDPERHFNFLLVPASPSGQGMSMALQVAMPNVTHVKVAGQSDLMFCRDYGPINIRDLCRIFKICSNAYNGLANTPNSSPHSRFDILDWMPLDPI